MPSSTAASRPKIRKQRYSLEWASDVIATFTEKYPRGYKIVSEKTGIVERQLAWLLACDDPNWPMMRHFIKSVQEWAEVSDYGFDPSPDTPQMFSSIVDKLVKKFNATGCEWLTEHFGSATLKEQSMKGVPE